MTASHAATLRSMARIAYISLHTSPLDSPGSRDAGGMNVVEMEHARALAQLGHTVELVTRRDSPHTPEVVEVVPGVTVRQVNAGPAMPMAKSAQEAFIEEFSAALHKLEPYDLIHSHHWMSGVAAIPVARTWGVPHVQSFHSVAALPGRELGEGEPPESPGRNAGEQFIAQNSDRVVAVSNYEAATIIERCGADPTRVKIVHPGVDTQVFRPVRAGEEPAPLPCTRNGKGEVSPHGYVLFAARLQPLKGPDLALGAVAGVPEHLRPDLVITGDVSQDFQAYRHELEDLSDSLGIGERVRWCGPQSREGLAALMRSARVVLVPSYSETFGLVALEANASGVPVLAAHAGGLGEAVSDRATGLLIESRDVGQWAQTLTALLADDSRRSTMGAAGRARALTLTWAAGARMLDELYTELLSTHQGARAGAGAEAGKNPAAGTDVDGAKEHK